MIIYFEFEEKRRKADVSWPANEDPVVVHLSEKELSKDFPEDLYFEIERGNKVVFTIENPDDERLTDLQNVLRRRLQEFANK